MPIAQHLISLHAAPIPPPSRSTCANCRTLHDSQYQLSLALDKARGRADAPRYSSSETPANLGQAARSPYSTKG